MRSQLGIEPVVHHLFLPGTAGGIGGRLRPCGCAPFVSREHVLVCSGNPSFIDLQWHLDLYAGHDVGLGRRPGPAVRDVSHQGRPPQTGVRVLITGLRLWKRRIVLKGAAQ